MRCVARDLRRTTGMLIPTGFVVVVGRTVEIVENEARGGYYRHAGENQPHGQFKSHGQNDPQDSDEMIVRREPLPYGPWCECRRQQSLQAIRQYVCQLFLRYSLPMIRSEIAIWLYRTSQDYRN